MENLEFYRATENYDCFIFDVKEELQGECLKDIKRVVLKFERTDTSDYTKCNACKQLEHHDIEAIEWFKDQLQAIIDSSQYKTK